MSCSEGTQNSKRADFGVLAAETRACKTQHAGKSHPVSSPCPGLWTAEGGSEHYCLCFQKGLSVPASSMFPTLIFLFTQLFPLWEKKNDKKPLKRIYPKLKQQPPNKLASSNSRTSLKTLLLPLELVTLTSHSGGAALQCFSHAAMKPLAS